MRCEEEKQTQGYSMKKAARDQNNRAILPQKLSEKTFWDGQCEI